MLWTGLVLQPKTHNSKTRKQSLFGRSKDGIMHVKGVAATCWWAPSLHSRIPYFIIYPSQWGILLLDKVRTLRWG